MLAEAYRALEPGGLLAIEMNNLLRPHARLYADEVVVERGDDQDDRPPSVRHPDEPRHSTERTIIRGGKRRSFEFSVRMFTPAELRSWMLDAGFREAIAYGDDGERADPGARGPTDDGRRPEVRVTISALSRHPRVTISSLRSLWGGGWGTGPQGGVQRLELGVDELDCALDALLVLEPRSSTGSRPKGAGAESAIASPWSKRLPDAGVEARAGRAAAGSRARPPGRSAAAAAAGAPIRARTSSSSCSRARGVRSPPPAGGTARVAARDRRAVERRVELVLVEPEPAARASGPLGRATAGARSPSTTPGAWPRRYARCPACPSSTGRDSIGNPASAQARHARLSRCSEASDRYDDRRRVTRASGRRRTSARRTGRLAVRRAPRRAPTRRSSACRPPARAVVRARRSCHSTGSTPSCATRVDDDELRAPRAEPRRGTARGRLLEVAVEVAGDDPLERAVLERKRRARRRRRTSAPAIRSAATSSIDGLCVEADDLAA